MKLGWVLGITITDSIHAGFILTYLDKVPFFSQTLIQMWINDEAPFVKLNFVSPKNLGSFYDAIPWKYLMVFINLSEFEY